MKKHSLVPNNGLSLSQAQSISNLCNQRALEINKKFENVNNYSKYVNLNDGKTLFIQKGQELPKDIVQLITEKARLYACQAFLMENIKAKEFLLKEVKLDVADISHVSAPKKPNFLSPNDNTLSYVDEAWGWSKLTLKEINEYYEAEAYAAHIGQFIHDSSILDKLRKNLPNIPTIEWITIKDGEKTPVYIDIHHDADNLMKLHENLAGIHRKYEQRVNYFKAKVKNIVTAENARIASHNNKISNDVAKQNALLQSEYDKKYVEYQDKIHEIRNEFEIIRQKKISEIAAMRISVDVRFQDVIDVFLNKLDSE